MYANQNLQINCRNKSYKVAIEKHKNSKIQQKLSPTKENITNYDKVGGKVDALAWVVFEKESENGEIKML